MRRSPWAGGRSFRLAVGRLESLAGASAAGHLIECGAQATGGLWHRWDAACRSRGNRLPDRRDRAGRLVRDHQAGGDRRPGHRRRRSPSNCSTRSMIQACYHTPDVDVDFTGLEIKQAGPERVSVQGAAGRPPSDKLKLVAVYRDGWTASGMLAVVGRHAEAKARAAGELVLERVRRVGRHAGRLAGRVPGRRRRRAGCLAACFAAVRSRAAGDGARPRARGGRAVLPRACTARDGGAAGHRRLRLRQADTSARVRILARARAAHACRSRDLRRGSARVGVGQGIASVGQIVNNSGRGPCDRGAEHVG